MASPTGRFRPSDRLRRSDEYAHVLRRGRRTVSGEFVVLVARGHRADERRRLGITVSRRIGGAVVRNHVKRRVREWFRASRMRLPAGADLVVIGRQGAGALTGREVAERLDAALADQVGNRRAS